MKKILILSILVLLSNCTYSDIDEPTINITGKWKLIEENHDSGDGISTWHVAPESRVYYYYFYENGVYKKINANNISNSQQGTYSTEYIENDKYGLEMKNNNNDIDKRLVYFEEENLIIVGGCWEYCADKFVKIE